MITHYEQCGECKKLLSFTDEDCRQGKQISCQHCGTGRQETYRGLSGERLYEEDGRTFSTYGQHEKYLKSKGRVLTEGTSQWRDIKKMAKEGQRRTLLSQKGHY